MLNVMTLFVKFLYSDRLAHADSLRRKKQTETTYPGS